MSTDYKERRDSITMDESLDDSSVPSTCPSGTTGTSEPEKKQNEGKGEPDEKTSSLDEEVTGDVELESKEGKSFTVRKKYVTISTLVKTVLEEDTSATSTKIPGVSTRVLARIVE